MYITKRFDILELDIPCIYVEFRGRKISRVYLVCD